MCLTLKNEYTKKSNLKDTEICAFQRNSLFCMVQLHS